MHIISTNSDKLNVFLEREREREREREEERGLRTNATVRKRVNKRIGERSTDLFGWGAEDVIRSRFLSTTQSCLFIIC